MILSAFFRRRPASGLLLLIVMLTPVYSGLQHGLAQENTVNPPYDELPPLVMKREKPRVKVLGIPDAFLGERPGVRSWTLIGPEETGKVHQLHRSDEAMRFVAALNGMQTQGMDFVAKPDNPLVTEADETWPEALLLAVQAVEGITLPEDVAAGSGYVRAPDKQTYAGGKLSYEKKMSRRQDCSPLPLLGDTALSAGVRTLLTPAAAQPGMDDLRAEGKEAALHRVMIFEIADRLRTVELARALAAGDPVLKGLREVQNLAATKGAGMLANPHVQTRVKAALEAWPECATARYYLNWQPKPPALFTAEGVNARAAILYHRVRGTAGRDLPYDPATKKELAAAEQTLAAWTARIPGGKSAPAVKALEKWHSAVRRACAVRKVDGVFAPPEQTAADDSMEELEKLMPGVGMERAIW